MFDSLHAFGFGPEFIKWIEVIYCNVKSCIINNGWMTNFFSLSRGVRQGCPLSALLFILCVEILACKIRQCEDVKGLPLPCSDLTRNVLKIAQLADDTTVFVNNEQSVVKVLKIMHDLKK